MSTDCGHRMSDTLQAVKILTFAPGVNSDSFEPKYAKWKVVRNERISVEGATPDATEDHKRIRSCFLKVMDAYLCHVELDELAGCAVTKKLIGAGDSPNSLKPRELDFHCAKPFSRYKSCLESEEKRATLTQAAATHSACVRQRANFQVCIERALDDPEMKPNFLLQGTEHLPCDPEHRFLLRCGLNHLWNDYFRTINGVGDAEDFLSFRVDGDDGLRSLLDKGKKGKYE